jgi:hypothetical protein
MILPMTSPAPAPPPSPDSPSAPGKSFLAAIDRVLYPITVGYTFVILGFVLAEWALGGRFRPRFEFGDVYLALLGAYAAQREGSKWLGADEASVRLRRGEMFVGLWFAVYLFVIAAANVSSRWAMPQELKAITLGVLGIFAATGISAVGRQLQGRRKSAGPVLSADHGQAALKLLQEHGSLTSAEIASRLSVSTASAWRLLENLEKEGQVRQEAADNPRDRRYRLI